jgi:hypothetical protein
MTYARMGWALFLTALLCVPSFALAGQKIDLRQSDGTITELGGDGSAAKTTLATTLAGERNVSSATDSYVAVRQEANAAIISKTTAVTIGGGVANDTHLMGLLIHTALTGTCAITGFADSDGIAQTYTLPAGSVGYKDFLGAINSAGALTITCSNASDDNLVMALWRPL